MDDKVNEKCWACGKKTAEVYWGGKLVCNVKKCLDKAWAEYQSKPQRRNGSNFGVGR